MVRFPWLDRWMLLKLMTFMRVCPLLKSASKMSERFVGKCFDEIWKCKYVDKWVQVSWRKVSQGITKHYKHIIITFWWNYNHCWMVNKMSTKICKTKSLRIIINDDSSYPPEFCSPAGQRERWRLLTTWGSEPRPAARPLVSWRSKWHRPKMSAVWSELEGPPPRRSPGCSLVERAESRETEVRRTFLTEETMRRKRHEKKRSMAEQ